ncbi:transposase [Streptomyces sp. NPDC002994]|uniref:transposase n=1 Tax=Streptomyces sp. NPDC002994 TaxID=3154441 RepID=UPI0033B23815
MLETIPGVGRITAEVLIAETGGDISRFPHHRPPGPVGGGLPRSPRVRSRHKSGRRRHGNRWLSAALGTAAMATCPRDSIVRVFQDVQMWLSWNGGDGTVKSGEFSD